MRRSTSAGLAVAQGGVTAVLVVPASDELEDGQHDGLLMQLHVADMGQLTKVVDRFLALGQTTTSIVQRSPIPLRRLPLPDANGSR